MIFSYQLPVQHVFVKECCNVLLCGDEGSPKKKKISASGPLLIKLSKRFGLRNVRILKPTSTSNTVEKHNNKKKRKVHLDRRADSSRQILKYDYFQK